MASTKRSGMWCQIGQSMAEYTVVMAALVGGLLVANRGACPNEYEDCIEYLLTVMHDNYDGYSASIAAVHEYAEDYEVAENSGDNGGSGPGESNGSGGSAGDGDTGGQPVAAISDVSMVSGNGGINNFGELDVDSGIVTQNGEVVGTYADGTFTANDGATSNASVDELVVDAEGNVLQRTAVTDCGDPAKVLGFGYESQADGKFYDAAQYEAVDVSSNCTEATYKIIDRDGASQPEGRIVDGFYYGFTSTPESAFNPDGIQPEGEVVYVDLGGASFCAVMLNGWDSGIDPDLSEEEFYAEQMSLILEPNQDDSAWFGTLDAEQYVEQVYFNGEDPSPNDCPSNRVIAEP
ncbi:hypothetical protein [Gilvimarinus sp. 1_MG-2023]|uniref:hypothetical protein n=1 Tax=Gilvimarinus sp. 1_MG-2023 TaxID=3062638 RepID=UPI0026E4239F|nr:hypothetical protein [Gilvimarinus sp. 1_MG-2023]MDO6748347.1 hypothetical protein [Gilvimarinus sp. 1_MG-2023]